MSDFVDRLERALLTAGARAPVSRTRRVHTLGGGTLLMASSAAVTAAVVAVVIIVAAGGHASPRLPGQHTSRPNGLVAPTVKIAPACQVRTGRNHRTVLPPLVMSPAAPAASLLNELALLRRPATHADRINARTVNRSPYEVLRIYWRYIRVVNGVQDTRLALIPATVCSIPSSTAVTPRDVLLMQILGPKFATPPPTIYVGTADEIRNGPALPGLDDATKHHAWLQATVVPDGVATVTMQFTPPFNRHYVRTVSVHGNTGLAFPLPAYTPTTTIWYGVDGRRLRTFVNKVALKYDQCLAKHHHNCNG
jgi:hypothetical protein